MIIQKRLECIPDIITIPMTSKLAISGNCGTSAMLCCTYAVLVKRTPGVLQILTISAPFHVCIHYYTTQRPQYTTRQGQVLLSLRRMSTPDTQFGSVPTLAKPRIHVFASIIYSAAARVVPISEPPTHHRTASSPNRLQRFKLGHLPHLVGGANQMAERPAHRLDVRGA